MNNSKRFISAFVCVFGLISSLVTLTFGQTAYAATTPWSGELEYETSEAVPPSELQCSKTSGRIIAAEYLIDTTINNLCVYQKPGWRYTSYKYYGDGWVYGLELFLVSFEDNDTFHSVEFGKEATVYTPYDNDMIYSERGLGMYSINNTIVKDYLSKITKSKTSAGATKYSFMDENGVNQAQASKEPLLKTSAEYVAGSENRGIDISRNGRYLVVEVSNGMVIYDRQTSEMKWFSGYITSYGYGMDGHFKFDISDDGTYVVQSGLNIRPEIYYLTPDCGLVIPDLSIASMERAKSSPKCASSNSALSAKMQEIRGPRAVDYVSRLQLSGDHKEMTFYIPPQKGEYDQFAPGEWLRVRLGPVKPKPLTYLALGDSYTSGEGDIGVKEDGSSYYLFSNEDAGKCHLSSRSYPFLIKDYWNVADQDMHSVACSGAELLPDYWSSPDGYSGQRVDLSGKSEDEKLSIRNDAISNYKPGTIPQLEFVKKYKPDILTITGGGNDVGFVDVLKYCAIGSPKLAGPSEAAPELIFGLFTCSFASPGSDTQKMLLSAIESQYGYTLAFLRKIHEESPNTKIYYIGYPQFVLDGNSSCLGRAGELDGFERDAVNFFVKLLNQKIQKAVTDSGVAVYIDIEHALDGGKICETGDYMTGGEYLVGNYNAIEERSNQIFHPNAVGHQKIASAITEKLASNAPQPEHVDLSPPLSVNINPPGGLGIAIHVPIVGDRFDPGDDIRFNMIGSSFSANSVVKLFIHSDPVVLGTYQADAAGGIDNEIVHIPENLENGFHLVTAKGTAPTGESVTYYQFVNVGLEALFNPKPTADNTEDVDLLVKQAPSTNQQVAMTSLAPVGSTVVPIAHSDEGSDLTLGAYNQPANTVVDGGVNKSKTENKEQRSQDFGVDKVESIESQRRVINFIWIVAPVLAILTSAIYYVSRMSRK